MGHEEVERKIRRSPDSGLPANLEALALHPWIRFFAHSPKRDAALAVWADEAGRTLPTEELVSDPESRAISRDVFHQTQEGLGESMKSRDPSIRARIVRVDFHPEDRSVLEGEVHGRRDGQERTLRVWWRYEEIRILGMAALGNAPVEEFVRRS